MPYTLPPQQVDEVLAQAALVSQNLVDQRRLFDNISDKVREATLYPIPLHCSTLACTLTLNPIPYTLYPIYRGSSYLTIIVVNHHHHIPSSSVSVCPILLACLLVAA